VIALCAVCFERVRLPGELKCSECGECYPPPTRTKTKQRKPEHIPQGRELALPEFI